MSNNNDNLKTDAVNKLRLQEINDNNDLSKQKSNS